MVSHGKARLIIYLCFVYNILVLWILYVVSNSSASNNNDNDTPGIKLLVLDGGMIRFFGAKDTVINKGPPVYCNRYTFCTNLRLMLFPCCCTINHLKIAICWPRLYSCFINRNKGHMLLVECHSA